MDVVLLIARVVLAIVFAVAGVAKLVDQAGSRKAIVDFGLPWWLAPLLAVALPLAELIVAVALLSNSWAWWGALGALALLLTFIAAISINLARGRRPECHCFGQLHSAPAGRATLARNGILAALSAIVVWQGPGSLHAVSRLAQLTAMQVVGLLGGMMLLAILAAEAWFLVQLFYQNGRLLVRIDALEQQLAASSAPPLPATILEPAPVVTPAGLALGSPAPPFRLPGLYDDMYTLEDLRADRRPIMLIFSDPDCGPCTALLPEIVRWQRSYASQLTIGLISRGTREINRAKSAEHELSRVMLQTDFEVAELYKVHGTPAAVIVRLDGTIGSLLALGGAEIRALVEHHARIPLAAANGQGDCDCGRTHDTPVRSAIAVGEDAPSFRLPDLGGELVGLDDVRGHPTLLLFWNPDCGFCRAMLNDLRAWDAHRPKDAPRLLLISSGAASAHQAMELRSTVLIDESFTVGRAFGVSGTPSAVLLDMAGKLASTVAVGADAVLALAGASQPVAV